MCTFNIVYKLKEKFVFFYDTQPVALRHFHMY